jgi:phosphatidylglycerol---prolipoprotein diacylglyceryl transferase
MTLRLPDIDPVIFHVGPLAIRWYALAYVAGIVLAWLYAGKLVRKTELWPNGKAPATADQLDDLVLWLTGGIILGGRLGYVLAYDAEIIWKAPLQVLQIWNGGMSFHGGFLGVVIATILWCRANRFTQPQMLNLGDLMAMGAPIGLLLGRIANFINGELWGRETDAPWGVVFCNKHITDQFGHCPAGEVARHPSQLYEAFGEGLLLFALAWFLAFRLKKLHKPGMIMGVFIAGYGIIRILLESVRNPDAQMLDFFREVITMGTLLSLPMVVAGAWLAWRAHKTPTPEPEPVPAAEDAPDETRDGKTPAPADNGPAV